MQYDPSPGTMGYLGRLCGRMTSLNHRVDLPEVLNWIDLYVD